MVPFDKGVGLGSLPLECSSNARGYFCWAFPGFRREKPRNSFTDGIFLKVATLNGETIPTHLSFFFFHRRARSSVFSTVSAVHSSQVQKKQKFKVKRYTVIIEGKFKQLMRHFKISNGEHVRLPSILNFADVVIRCFGGGILLK